MITSYKNRTIDYTRPVKVYRNLNRKGKVYSIQQDGLVVAYGNNFGLISPKFKVSEAGRQRVLKEQRKNVHAYMIGLMFAASGDRRGMRRIMYNPYKWDSFIDEHGDKVFTANAVVIKEEGVFIN